MMCLSSLLVEPASTKENNCLNAAKACNLNDTCKKYRSAYINPCTSRVSASEVCNKRKCHKALRQFFDKVNEHVNFENYVQLFVIDFVVLALKPPPGPGVKYQRGKCYFKFLYKSLSYLALHLIQCIIIHHRMVLFTLGGSHSGSVVSMFTFCHYYS